MALKVLLADDSVPAQNMGKKILTDAGYEVQTVSNGLEALRKIADMIPDIAILDIFMPGYTGLEICARLRSNAATAELPVILTVGKLEPYRPEDGEHVHSNAVIVKPFAAVELTSAVRSLIGSMPVPVEDRLAPKSEDIPPVPVAEPPATVGQFADPLPAEVPDEPLFSGVAYGTARNAEPLSPQFAGAIVDAVEPLQADEEPLGAESLVFNPDAVHTQFSACVVEPPPAVSHFPAQAGPSGFTEFDLEPESPHSAEPFPAAMALESWHPAPEATAQNDTAEYGEMAGFEPLAIAAEPAMATNHVEAAESGEAVRVAVAPAELESSPLNVPAIEPLAEVHEGAYSGGALASSVAADGAPEAIHPEAAASSHEVAWNATAAQPAQGEEAGGQAFEQLYNSDVPFPLEENPVPFPGPAIVMQPELTETSKQEPGESGPDPEIVMDAETAMDDHLNALTASAPDPALTEDFQPIRAIEPIFEGERLLEDKTPADWAFTGSVQPPAEAFASALGDHDAPLTDTAGDSTPRYYAEAPPGEPEIPGAAAAVESEPPAPVDSPERSHLVAEVAKVEALLVQMQAVRQAADEETEVAHTETEFQQSDVAAYPLQPTVSTAQPEESTPVEAQEEMQEEAVTGPAQIETELQQAADALVEHEPEAEPEQVCAPPEIAPEELAHSGAEAWVEETSSVSAQRLNEAERIHQAVEKVFDRFRPLLVAAIVREMARHD